jgi:4'-phosphopantetheinyl transferase EntD
VRPLSLAADLFPPCVAVHALHLDAPSEADLDTFRELALPEQLATAVLKRRVEFLAGRYCARAALRIQAPELAELAVAAGEQREPLWPSGIAGAISHTSGYAAAAIARASDARGIGLDIERWVKATAPETIGSHVSHPGELEALVAQTGWSASEALTLVFSAKEAVYKCLYPEVRRYFGFHDATIERIDVERGTFVARLAVALTEGLPAGFALEGRFERRDDVIVTALILTRR